LEYVYQSLYGLAAVNAKKAKSSLSMIPGAIEKGFSL
jgi:hypothetical protein